MSIENSEVTVSGEWQLDNNVALLGGERQLPNVPFICWEEFQKLVKVTDA